MEAQRQGGDVVLVMSATEARQLEDELLWCSDEDKTLIRAWEALKELGERNEVNQR